MNNNEIIQDFDAEVDTSLKISLQENGLIPQGIIISLNGYVDIYNASFFQNQIKKVIAAGYINIVFNCTGLNYVSSTGIGAFSLFLKLVKAQAGDIVLFGLNHKVEEIMTLLGFTQIFKIVNTEDEAVLYFKQEEAPAESVFPKVFACPVCSKRLKAGSAGRFRCSECKAILAVDIQGNILLG